jgi:hypothetical protein
MIQSRLYVAANAAFATCVLAGLMVRGPVVHPLYLLLLFALCSSPILNVRQLNDEYVLLGLFSLLYFFWYGFLDFLHLLSGQIGSSDSGGILDAAEVVILFGGALVQISYRFACRAARPASSALVRDWPEGTLTFIGLTLWVGSTWLVWKYSVEVIADASIESVKRGLASLSPIQADVFMLATYFQPFSVMVLAYALFKYKRSYMTSVVIGAVLVQFVLGFVADAKGQALSGLIIVLIAKFLVDRKIPKIWLASAVAIVLVAFPVLQANRAIRHQSEMSHAAAAENLGKAFQQALQAKEQTNTGHNRAQSVFERVSVKDTVEVIVTKTGHGVPFRHGDTLGSLLTAFIPRLIWPTKPGIQVGLLVAKEFFPGESAEVNLSPSHLGELYWNFGFLGVLFGMPVIGATFGLVASKCNLAQAVTLTRVLVLLVTIQVVVQGFEASVAIQYSVWLRMMLGIGLLHLVFARPRAIGSAEGAARGVIAPQVAPSVGPHFPNLLR